MMESLWLYTQSVASYKPGNVFLEKADKKAKFYLAFKGLKKQRIAWIERCRVEILYVHHLDEALIANYTMEYDTFFLGQIINERI